MPKPKSLDASLAHLGDSGASLQADRKLSESLNAARRRCLDAAERMVSAVGEVALSAPFSSSKSPEEIRSTVRQAAVQLAREFKEFLVKFPDVRKWWQKLDVSRLYELLDAEVWPGKPLVELKACKDATRQQRQAFCEIAVRLIEGKLNQASLDRVLATVDPTWVSYIVPSVNVMTGGQPRLVECEPPTGAGEDSNAAVDESAFVFASVLHRSESRFPDIRACTRFVDANEDKIRQLPGKGRRRLVHSGDWHRTGTSRTRPRTGCRKLPPKTFSPLPRIGFRKKRGQESI